MKALSRAKVSQADFWPELCGKRMVALARVTFTPAVSAACPQRSEDTRQTQQAGQGISKFDTAPQAATLVQYGESFFPISQFEGKPE